MAKLGLPLDREALLAPISDSQPCGESLRYEGTYDSIKEARREDDPHLPQGVWKRELKVADMQQVGTLCLEALATRTKDLQIAAWLTEALSVLHSMQGCAEGLGLMADLCEHFWDGLHPHMEDGDSEFRTAPIDWLDGTLPLRLRLVQISDPSSRDASRFTFGNWDDAIRHEAHPHDSVPEDQPDKSDIIASWSLTDESFFCTQVEHLETLQQQLQRFVALLSKILGDDAPSLRRTRECVSSLERVFDRALPGGRPAETVPETANTMPEAEDEDEDEAVAVAEDETNDVVSTGSAVGRQLPAATPGSGPVRSRTDAYERLREVAEYLLRTEPHSPSGYLVQRAVAWGEMGLGDVLAEIVASSDDLRTIYALLGITPKTISETDETD